MKKTTIFMMGLLLATLNLSADHRAAVSFSAGVQTASDENYRKVYGDAVFLPELKGVYRLTGNLSIWAGYGLLSQKGTTPVLEAEAFSTQHVISLGGGYAGRITEKLSYGLDLGMVIFSYREEAPGEEVSGSPMGFRIDGSLAHDLTDVFFGGLKIGYLAGSDTVNGVDVTLGGFTAGMLVGLRF